MAISHAGWAETRLVPSKTLTGSMAVNYEDSLVAIHAVPIVDEIPGDVTVCGKRVSKPENRTGDFDRHPPTAQCGRCTDRLGYEVRGER